MNARPASSLKVLYTDSVSEQDRRNRITKRKT